jgi:RecA-family ATPase
MEDNASYDPEKEIEMVCRENNITIVDNEDPRRGHDVLTKLKSLELLNILHSELLLFKDKNLKKGILMVGNVPVEVKRDIEPELSIIYDKDLKNLHTQKIKWLIKDILPENSINFLGGKRGTFKSFLGLHITYCLASGKLLFNTFETQKTKVLYLDEENGLALIKERSEKIKKGLEIDKDLEEVAFLSFANLKLDKKEWIDQLESFLQEFQPKVVVVDSLRRFVRFDENEAGQVSRLFTEFLRPISQKHGLSWILLHHMRKGIGGKNPVDDMDELRGSSDLSNYADVILLLQRNRGSNDSVVLKQPKNRYQQEITSKVLRLEWESDSLKIISMGDAEESIYADEVCAKMIISWMAENEIATFKTKDVLEAMKNEKQTKPTTERALKRLLEQGTLLKPQRGVYELSANLNLNDFIEPSKHQNHQDCNKTKETNEESIPLEYNKKDALMVKNKEKRSLKASTTIYSEASDDSDGEAIDFSNSGIKEALEKT